MYSKVYIFLALFLYIQHVNVYSNTRSSYRHLPWWSRNILRMTLQNYVFVILLQKIIHCDIYFFKIVLKTTMGLPSLSISLYKYIYVCKSVPTWNGLVMLYFFLFASPDNQIYQMPVTSVCFDDSY